MARIGISQREYARRRGVSHTAVQRAIESGRITPEFDGSIDPAKADAQWAMQRGAQKWDVAGYFGVSMETVERTYGHHHPDFQKSAVEAMERRR